jgi:hypothetical protein
MELRVDERKQRQQHRIAEELASDKISRDSRARHIQLYDEREDLAHRAAHSEGPNDLADVWDTYVYWITSNNLPQTPTNAQLQKDHSAFALRQMPNLDFQERARAIENAIRSTDIEPKIWK